MKTFSAFYSILTFIYAVVIVLIGTLGPSVSLGATLLMSILLMISSVILFAQNTDSK
jgi:hypothetical protein